MLFYILFNYSSDINNNNNKIKLNFYDKNRCLYKINISLIKHNFDC